MGVNTDAVQRLYVAYFNRPADPVGLAYWESQLDALTGGAPATQAQLESIAAGFSGSAEYAALYAGMTNTQIINALYNNLFGRDAEPAGLVYWAGALTSGSYTFAQIALQLTYSAQGTDATAIANKLAAATAFTTALDTTAEIVGYDGMAAAAAARSWLAAVVDTDASLTTALAGLDTAVATATSAGTSIPGATFNLTTGIDEVTITTTNTVDTVKGYWEGKVGTDTFSVADVITGNGLTNLQLVVGASGTAPYVEMTGVDKLSIVAATTASFDMDASSYGSDISTIALSGADNFDLDVTNLTVKGQLELTTAAGSDSEIFASGTMDGVCFSISSTNDDVDSVGAVVKAGLPGIGMTLGQADWGWAYLYQTAAKTAAAVTVGDLTVGDISINMGKSASASVTFENYACNGDTNKGTASAGSVTVGNITTVGATHADVWVEITNTACASGAATVGNITVGNMSLQIGDSGCGDMCVTNYAYSWGKGAATAGNITFGDMSVKIGASGTHDFCVYNSATATSGAAAVGNVTFGNIDIEVGSNAYQSYFCVANSADATKGNATAGNISFGNINVAMDDSACTGLYMCVENYACATTSGNAKVGNITYGDINVTGGDDACVVDLYVSNSAYAQKGTATAGDITFGGIDVNIGDGAACVSVTLVNCANVATSGAATAGAIKIGDVSMAIGSTGTAYFCITNEAYTAKGAAVVGDITVGNLTNKAGLGSYMWNQIYACADGTANDVVGNITVGNVDFYGEPDADLNLSIIAYADAGSVGNITLGNVDMAVDNSGSVDLYICAYAKKDIGNITLGDVTMTLGSYATIDSFTICASANTGSIGNITLGDITVTGALGASDNDNGFCVWASKNVGDITVGDFTVTAAQSASFSSFSWDFTASTGSIGNVSVGDVTLAANGQSAYIWASHDYYAGDDVGTVTYGNIALTASGQDAYAGFSISATATDAIGAVTIGNVAIAASGQSASASFWAYFSTSTSTGAAKAGNIDITVSNTKSAAAGAYAYYELESKGAVTVGDIKLAAGAATAAFVNTATVDADVVITSTGGSVTVGNITVTGGYKNSGSTLLDNFDDLTWLALTKGGSGTITVGNIDYSGYTAAATLDVSGWGGAGVIKASSGGSTITDNKGKNEIYLGAGVDTVNISDITVSTTDKTDATKLDVIHNFSSGVDLISVEVGSHLQTDFAFVSSDAGSYAAFLTAAGSAMTTFGTDIYARKVGGDIYVAFDHNADGAVSYVIKLAGISAVVASDFALT